MERPDFSDCGTTAVMALIRVKDDQVRERAILLCKNALNRTNATGGKWKTRLTEREIKKIIDTAERQMRTELTKKILEERNEASSVAPETTESSSDQKSPREPELQTPTPITSQDDPIRRNQIKLAESFWESLSTEYQLIALDIMQKDRKGYPTVLDVFCTALTVLAKRRKKRE